MGKGPPINLFIYRVKSKIIDSPIAPPDMSVPAHLAVIESPARSCLAEFSLTHFTKFFTSSESFGKRISFGRISKRLASCEYFTSVVSSSFTSPLKNFCISDFTIKKFYFMPLKSFSLFKTAFSTASIAGCNIL